MNKFNYGLVVLLFICFRGNAQHQQEGEIILERYKQFLFLTDTATASYQSIPPVNAKGRWTDIDYSDSKAGRWELSDHMGRIRRLSMAYMSNNSHAYHSDSVKKSIDRALSDWFAHRYQSKNWWHNEIGIPQLMRDIIILLDDSLAPAQRKNCLEILDQHMVKGTGANLIWSADLGMHYGILTGDEMLAKRCRDTILSVIRITTEEGVQPDYSFHQHGKRLQMYHYGGAFLLDDVRLAWQLRGLSLAFPAPKIKILTEFVLNGWQWMARGIHTVPGTIDRAASRKNAMHSADIRNIIPLLYDLLPDSARAFRRMLQAQNGNFSLIGYRYFPYSDFTAFHQKNYSFLLKTASERTLLTESINEENLKGDLLNMGDGYFIHDGSEYFNLMPFWDWKRLPGITNFESEGNKKLIRKNFVGNVSDGSSGLAVMDYSMEQKDNKLSARKFWASWNNLTIVLIADIKTKNLKTPAFTALDQSRWQSQVRMNTADNILNKGVYVLNDVKWIHHNKFAYIPLYNDSIQLVLKNVAAKWWDINHSESDELIYDKIFMPSIIHRSDRSGYVVGYAPKISAITKLVRRPPWNILRNDSLAQVIRFRDKQIMAALYSGGLHRIDSKLTIQTSHPLLLLIKEKSLYVSDPSHTGGLFSFSINGKRYAVELSSTGTSTFIPKS